MSGEPPGADEGPGGVEPEVVDFAAIGFLLVLLVLALLLMLAMTSR